MYRLASVVVALCLSALSVQAYDFSSIDRLLADSVDAVSGSPGGYALLLVRDNEELYSRSFGAPSYTIDRVIPIASATKWLSAAVLLSLVDDSLLSLDDTVGAFLPTFTGAKAQMTIRQLMSHTSGLPNDAPYISDRSLTLQEAADSIGLYTPMSASPGTQFVYGGVSMQVAGRIAELAGGKPWDTLFAERIARPLGMTSTDYEGLGRTDNPQIGGAARSSARDYMLFLRMLLNNGTLNGNRILSPESVRIMHEDQTRGAEIVYSPYSGYDDLDTALAATRYGIGNWRERVAGNGEIIESSSQGAFGFSPWIDREHRMAGVLSVRSLMRTVMPTYRELKRLLRTILDAPTSVDATAASPQAQVFPTPSSGSATIRMTGAVPQHIVLVDAVGRYYDVPWQAVATGDTTTVQLATHHLAPGSYRAILYQTNTTTTVSLVVVW